MRGSFALVVLCAVVGCASVRKPVNRETRAELSSSGYVTMPRLADNLDLDYHGEGSGYIELSAPPDHVMLVRDSRRALVNGAEVSMRHPCIRRGRQFVLTSADANLLARHLDEIRHTRVEEAAPPAPTPVTAPRDPRANNLPFAWRPDPSVAERDWRYIVIHHSATPRGAARSLHLMHKRRGWDGLGYHFVVGNGTESGSGQVELGFRWKVQREGAHVRVKPNDSNFWNKHAIGVCLVGDFMKRGPGDRQFDAAVELVRRLCAQYDIPPSRVRNHGQIMSTFCPGAKFPWDEFQRAIR